MYDETAELTCGFTKNVDDILADVCELSSIRAAIVVVEGRTWIEKRPVMFGIYQALDQVMKGQRRV